MWVSHVRLAARKLAELNPSRDSGNYLLKVVCCCCRSSSPSSTTLGVRLGEWAGARVASWLADWLADWLDQPTHTHTFVVISDGLGSWLLLVKGI